jgi:hypothetical protein
VSHGGSITFTIAPTTSYHIADVGVDGASAGALTSYTFSNVTASHTLSAAFALNAYSLTVGLSGQGQVTRTPSQTTYLHGSVVTLTATPALGWYLGQWSGDASGILTQTTVASDANKIVTATFLATPPTYYTLTMGLVGNGVITPDSGGAFLSGGYGRGLERKPGGRLAVRRLERRGGHDHEPARMVIELRHGSAPHPVHHRLAHRPLARLARHAAHACAWRCSGRGNRGHRPDLARV